MKKYLLGIIFGLFILTNPIKAASEYSYDFASYDGYLYYNEFTSKKTFIDIKDYTDPSLVVETKADGTTIYYKEFYNRDTGEFRRYGEWFKKQNGKWFNFKESIENGRKTDSEFFLESIDSGTYKYDAAKCQSGADFINDNCQSKMKTNMDFKYYMGTRTAVSYEITYPNNQYVRDDTYAKFVYKEINRDVLQNYITVDITRDSKNRITKARESYYNKNKRFLIRETLKVDNKGDVYDYNNLQSYGERYLHYDKNNKLRKIENYKLSGNIGFVGVYEKRLNYHKNGKLATTLIEKRNLNNHRYYHIKMKYNNKGKKQKFIKYSFKKNKITKRYEYVYNAKGNLKGKAYRYTTSYKKGKNYRTYKYYYNSKGKTYKRIKVKHRKDFYVTNYYNAEMEDDMY